MMKKVVLLASFVGASLLANAQVSVGPIIGIGIQGPRNFELTDNSNNEIKNAQGATIQTSKAGSSTSFYQPSPGLSFKVGAQIKIDIHPYFALTTGIAYQRMSYKISDPGSKASPARDVKGGLNYISIPLIPQFQYPINKKITIGIGVGPEINFFVGGKYTSAVSGQPTATVKYKVKGAVDKSDIEEQEKLASDDNASNEIDYIKPLDISLNIAPFVQFKLNGMSVLVSPTYYVGLSDISPDIKYSNVTNFSGLSYINNVDKKQVSRTGGFGLNASLLFGKTSGAKKRRK